MGKITEKITRRTNPFSKPRTAAAASYNQAVSGEDLQRRIQEKAYELFERRGCIHGNDLNDWLEAERIIKSQDN